MKSWVTYLGLTVGAVLSVLAIWHPFRTDKTNEPKPVYAVHDFKNAPKSKPLDFDLDGLWNVALVPPGGTGVVRWSAMWLLKGEHSSWAKGGILLEGQWKDTNSGGSVYLHAGNPQTLHWVTDDKVMQFAVEVDGLGVMNLRDHNGNQYLAVRLEGGGK